MSTVNASPSSSLTRRRALQAGAGVAASASLLPHLNPASAAANADFTVPEPTPADAGVPGHLVFQHGVASGDPYPDSVLLWTRATSSPADEPGLEAGTAVPLHWEVARDEAFTDIVAAGDTESRPERDNTVRVEPTGLTPFTRYFYRFIVTQGPYAGQISTVGRTQTAPAADDPVNRFRIALFSCAHYETGYFTAYRHMATRGDIDLALHVGDYIYEGGGSDSSPRRWKPTHEIVTLSDYRQRYGTYRTDLDLQAAHAAAPWMVTWDDHEVTNNTWSDGAQNHQPDTEGDFHARRDNAMQAYMEWLPMRATPFSEGGHLYRGARFGQLADVSMLDLRSYRSEQLGYLEAGRTDDPNRTLMGSEQFQWLADRLTTSDTRWNVIGNSVIAAPLLAVPLEPRTTKAITELLGLPQGGMIGNPDQWDGYAHEQRRLFQLLRDLGQANTLFLTGDVHTSWAMDLPYNAANYPGEGIVGIEVVGTSVTSTNVDDYTGLPQGNALSQAAGVAISTVNHHVRFVDLDWHGYEVVQLEPDLVHTDWVWVEDRRVPDSGVFIGKSMEARRGQGWAEVSSALNPADHVPGREGV